MKAKSRSGQFHRAWLAAGLASGLGICVVGYAAPTDDGSSDTAPAAHSDSVGAAIDDTAITAKVKAKFLGDDRLKNSHIKVVTTNGVVTLTGRASSADARSTAEELAQDVSGVKSVDDQLSAPSRVHKAVAESEQVGSDSWITTKVKTDILAHSVSKGFEVHVKTINGVVMLRGTLPNDDAIAHVKDLTERVEGVKSVDTSGLKAPAG
jgi:hyperosmotically inducible protein